MSEPVPIDVSVVIPTLNGAATLGAQITAVLAQQTTATFEVVVVDNGSTDATAALATSFAAADVRVRLVSEPRPGINNARNAGVRAARGRVVVLCDCDDIVAHGWLDAMWRGSATADLVGGALDVGSINDRQTLDRWGVPGPLLATETPGAFLPSPYGANCGFRRSVWVELGGFDEDFRIGGDESEFFWRAQLAGHTYQFVEDAVVEYRLRPDWKSVWRRQYRFGKANVLTFVKFHDHGLPRSSDAIALKGWMWSLAVAPIALMRPASRGVWVRTTAKRCGRLVGSVRLRCRYL